MTAAKPSPRKKKPTAVEPVEWKTFTIEGKTIQVRKVPQCYVCGCSDDDRWWIERGLILNHSYHSIVTSQPETSNLWKVKRGEGKPTLDVAMRRVQTHSLRGHSNVDAAVARAIMEAHAVRAGIDLTGAGPSIVNELGLLAEVQRLGYEHMVVSGQAPTINQALKAAQISLQYREIAGDSHAEVFQAGITAFMKALQRHLDEDTVRWIISDLEADEHVTAAFQAAFEALAVE